MATLGCQSLIVDSTPTGRQELAPGGDISCLLQTTVILFDKIKSLITVSKGKSKVIHYRCLTLLFALNVKNFGKPRSL